MNETSSALNWYSAGLAAALAAQGLDVVVLAVDDGGGERTWHDGSVRVRHVCRRGSPSLPIALARALASERPDILHVQHELFAYGGIASAALLIAALRRARTARRPIVTTIHGVIPLDRITPEFVRLNGVAGPARLVRFVWRNMLRAAAQLSDAVIVHGKHLRTLLANQYGVTTRLEVIPIGIDPKPPLDAAAARARLGVSGSPVVLFFGFLSSYKGIDYLADEMAQLRKRAPGAVVVIAGDVPRRLRERTNDLSDAVARLQREPNVRMLGFIEEERVDDVFAAADVVVLPYRVVMAASGPMSIALAHRRPVLVSSEFRDYRDTPLSFELLSGALANAVGTFVDEPGRAALMLDYQQTLLDDARWDRVAERTIAVYRACAEAAR
jgi:glycosyltransferase involved in cell wall biosynthesis